MLFNIIFAFTSLTVSLPASCVGSSEVLGQEGSLKPAGSSPGHQETTVWAPSIHLNSSAAAAVVGGISGLCLWPVLSPGAQVAPTGSPGWTWPNAACVVSTGVETGSMFGSSRLLHAEYVILGGFYKCSGSWYAFYPSKDSPSGC